MAKAGGIAPLSQLLEEGTVKAKRFAADALARLAIDSPDNQSAIAKKLVGLIGSGSPEAQKLCFTQLLARLP